MTWVCRFSAAAEHDLRSLPKAIQRRVGRALTQMASDPFQGNVKALQGPESKGVFRRRMGDYRLLFSADHSQGIVIVHQICLRSGGTYR